MKVKATLIVKLNLIYKNININDDDLIIKIKQVLFNISNMLYNKYRFIEIILNNTCLIRFDKNGYIINTEIKNLENDIINYEPFIIINNFIKKNEKIKIK